MGIAERKIVVKIQKKLEAAKKLLTYMIDDEAEILAILQGEDVSDDEAGANIVCRRNDLKKLR